MAIAGLPPHEQARLNRKRAEQRALNSPDPVERWKAKERAFNRDMAQISAAMVQQAHENARAMERQEREAQRFEQEYNRKKYNY